MADAFGAGKAFRDFLANYTPPAVSRAGSAALDVLQPQRVVQRAATAAQPTLADFITGLTGAARPTATVVLPAPTPATGVPSAPLAVPADTSGRAAKVAQATARDLAPKGSITPGALAVLRAAGANITDHKENNAAAALAGLSFRQLLGLSQAAANVAPRGVVRPPSSADQANAMLASIYQQQFSKSLSDAGDDPAKQKAAVDVFEQKMLPLAKPTYLPYGYDAGGQ